MSFTSDEVNYLIYRYLSESGMIFTLLSMTLYTVRFFCSLHYIGDKYLKKKKKNKKKMRIFAH